MDLILWRHAEAVDADDPFDAAADLARPLTPKGERQARRMADWLALQLTDGTRILASPAVRTQQTVQALQRSYRTVDGLAPGAGVDALLQAARWPDARRAVLVVGHQPTLGLTAGRLLTGSLQPMALRKGALVWLRQRDRDGQQQVVLHAAIGPEMVG